MAGVAQAGMAVQLVAPSEVLMKNDPGPYNQKVAEKVQRETQLVSGLMFVDKVEKEKIVKDQTPIYEKAMKQLELIKAKITVQGKKAVSALKNDELFIAAKSALSDIGFEVKYSLQFCHVDMEERNSNRIVYKRKLEKISGESSYRDTWKSDEIELDFTDAMKTLQTKFWEQYDIAETAKDKIIKAETALRDRANRMADAQGLVALKNMSQEDLALVKEIHVKREETDVTKLLAGKSA